MKTKQKVTAKPTRSFLPVDPKPIKTLHFRGAGAPYIGEVEPDWPILEAQNKWTRTEYEKRVSMALNWYSHTQDDKEIISLGFAALNLSGHFPELLVTLDNSTLTFSVTAARLLRMAHNGLFLRFRERRFIVREIRKCVN